MICQARLYIFSPLLLLLQMMMEARIKYYSFAQFIYNLNSNKRAI